MSYIGESVGSQLPPKYFGTYECELIPILEELSRIAFPTIIDVGAAEGFYAVGCAIKWPNSQVIAFETSAHGRDSIGELARLNGVSSRVTILGHCEVKALAEAVPCSGESLVIVDVEGAEYDLLQPSLIPALQGADILVEVHERVHPDLEATLKQRFAATHSATVIGTRPRTLADFVKPHSSLLRRLFQRSLIAAVDEWRGGPMQWLYFAPTTRRSRKSSLS